jgi:hypothetical protein
MLFFSIVFKNALHVFTAHRYFASPEDNLRFNFENLKFWYIITLYFFWLSVCIISIIQVFIKYLTVACKRLTKILPIRSRCIYVKALISLV